MNYELARKLASSSIGFSAPVPESTASAISDALHLADTWLDGACALPAGATRAVAWTPQDWTAAVRDALAFLQDRALFTRIGVNSCAQVPTHGMVATLFDHWDTRTGDPNLHTHVVVSNKVQGLDGVWRSLDSRALHHAAVAVMRSIPPTIRKRPVPRGCTSAGRRTCCAGAGW